MDSNLCLVSVLLYIYFVWITCIWSKILISKRRVGHKRQRHKRPRKVNLLPIKNIIMPWGFETLSIRVSVAKANLSSLRTNSSSSTKSPWPTTKNSYVLINVPADPINAWFWGFRPRTSILLKKRLCLWKICCRRQLSVSMFSPYVYSPSHTTTKLVTA